jgi:Ca2+-transporting ATPase
LLITGALCNDSKLNQENEQWDINGDSTEGAFLVVARKAGLGQGQLNEEFPRIAENPFDSERKYMSTIHRTGSDRFIVYSKGATDRLLPLCTRKLEGGEIKPITEADQQRIHQMNDDMASHAYRVLALAYKESDSEIKPEDAESDLIFLGLVGMIDAPRKEAIAAIGECRDAGIRVVMITGDHKLTAVAIARQMGIANERSLAYTGVELNAMSDEELYNIVERVAVYARVSPEHKMRIIAAWKKRGQIVAMTGDGVNDAPALKKADIGVAMGITGTDVSKEAAEMVLTDDNFASIVHAVEEGRNIYSNIRKFVSFLLSCNMGEVATIFTATLIFTFTEPFLFPLQILWMNLVTDGLPALALGLEPADPDAMEHPPKDPDEPPINRSMMINIMIVGLIVASGTLAAFVLKYDASMLTTDPGYQAMMDEARTMAFTTIVLFQMAYVFSARSLQLPIYKIGFFTNKYLIAAAGGSIILQLMVVYVPFLQNIFSTVPLPLEDWFIILPLVLSVFVIMEIVKFVKWKMKNRA